MRTKDIFQSTLREYFGDTYEEDYEELSEILFEELTDGLPALTIEERIEFTLREYFMDREILTDEINIKLEEATTTIMYRLKEM